MKHIVSYSGGKDSTAMLLRMIEEGMPIDEIVFIDIKATKDLGAEFPYMYEYLEKVEAYVKEHRGIGITRVGHHNGMTFEDYFYKVVSRGKNEGKMYGWPYTLGAWCNSRLKIAPIDKYFNSQGEHIRYVGIALDEPKRLKGLADNVRTPLVDWKMTEADCLQYLKDRGFHNKLYDEFARLGCWFCPKQNLNSLRTLRKNYPELWAMLLEWDKDTDRSFRSDGKKVWELEERFKNEEIGGK